MSEWSAVQQVLDFAIGEEEAAAEFYAQLATRMDKPAMRRVFESFAAEELKHKEKLLGVRQGQSLGTDQPPALDLQIAEYTVDVQPADDMGYQEALILAMKKEKEAFRLYTRLAETAEGEVKDLFLGIAQEEAKHKLYFEVEYDNLLTDN